MCPCPSESTPSTFCSGLINRTLPSLSPHWLPLFPLLSVCRVLSLSYLIWDLNPTTTLWDYWLRREFFLPAYFSLGGNCIYCFNQGTKLQEEMQVCSLSPVGFKLGRQLGNFLLRASWIISAVWLIVKNSGIGEWESARAS